MHHVDLSPGAISGLAFENVTPDATARLRYAEKALPLTAGEDAPVLMRSLHGQVLMQQALAEEEIGIAAASDIDRTMEASLDSLLCRDPYTQRARAAALITALRIRNMRLVRGEHAPDDSNVLQTWSKEAEGILQQLRDVSDSYDPLASTLDLERAIVDLFLGDRVSTCKLAMRGILRARHKMPNRLLAESEISYANRMVDAHLTVAHAVFQKPTKQRDAIHHLLYDRSLYTHMGIILGAPLDLPKQRLAA